MTYDPGPGLDDLGRELQRFGWGAALLRGVREASVAVHDWVRRARIVFRIVTLPPDVFDYQKIEAGLFPTPAKNADHLYYRQSFAHIVAMPPEFGAAPDADRRKERNRWLLTLAQLVGDLETMGDDPLGNLRRARRRKPEPETPQAPRTSPPQTLLGSVAAAPLPLWGYVSQGLGVVILILGALLMASMSRSHHLKVELTKARDEASFAQAQAKAAANRASQEYEARAEQTDRAIEEARASAKLQTDLAALRRRLAQRQKEAADADRKARDAGVALDIDERLRRHGAQPLSGSGVPAAASGGDTAGGVHDDVRGAGDVPVRAPDRPQS